MNSMLRKALRKHNGLRQQVENMLLGDDGDEVEAELRNFVAKRPCWVPITESGAGQAKMAEKKMVATSAPTILRLISEGREIIVSACDGQETIAEAGDIFTAGIDSDFARWGTNIPGQATGPTPASVYEQIENANFRQMFTSLCVADFDRLCWSQAQIKCFVRSHKKWLRSDGWVTFFLFKVGDEFFVAFVHVDAVDGPRVRVDRFSCGRVWRAERRFRVVVPQLPL